MITSTTHRTPAQIAGDIAELIPHVCRERDATPHAGYRLGRRFFPDAGTFRFRDLSAAADHLLAAMNLLSALDVDGEDLS